MRLYLDLYSQIVLKVTVESDEAADAAGAHSYAATIADAVNFGSAQLSAGPKGKGRLEVKDEASGYCLVLQLQPSLELQPALAENADMIVSTVFEHGLFELTGLFHLLDAAVQDPGRSCVQIGTTTHSDKLIAGEGAIDGTLLDSLIGHKKLGEVLEIKGSADPFANTPMGLYITNP